MGLKSREKRWGFHNRQLKLTVKEERIPANFQLRSALPEAVLLFAVDLAAVSTTCGSSYFCRWLGNSQHNPRQFFFLPSAWQQSAQPVAVIIFAVGLAAVSTVRGSSSFAVGLVTVSTTCGSSYFCRQPSSSQHYPRRFLFLPSALADG
jgi:dipeptide/tripeptide permease